MPALVINGLIKFLGPQLNASVWDGEIPRYDINGNAINPESVTVPSDFPVFKAYMEKPGFNREWQFEDAYIDTGTILVKVWGLTRASVETLVDKVDVLLASSSNWATILFGGPVTAPDFAIHILLSNWYTGQEEGIRTERSEFIYLGEMNYEVKINASVSTA